MGFNLVSLAITIRSDDAACLSSCLPLLGNEYAAVCRGLICHWPERVCETCSTYDACGWHLVFGQKLTSDPVALKRHQKPTLPFVFSFYGGDMKAEARKEIVCGLVVVGQAISHLEMLLDGFAELLSSRVYPDSAEIIQVACRDYQDSVQKSAGMRSGGLLPANLVILSTDGLLESRTLACSDLHIRLLSPLRLLQDGRPATCFDFSRFTRSVMRRVSSMAYYYGESELDFDFKELSRQADDVICTNDHFSCTATKNRKLSGISGYGSFLGNFSGLLPILVIGSYVHTGKGTSFGMGSYELLAVDGTP
jgi:hypothetical protein